MYPLHLAFHDGFRNHVVTVQIDGQQVYRKSDVTTDLTISRADAVDLLAPAKARIDVSIEPGNHRASYDADVAANPFLAVELCPEGAIVFREAKAPFRYM